MKITYTRDTLPDERVIQTVPGIKARVEEEHYHRPHIYNGRALTDKTLNQNARHHIRQLQLFGQHFSSGVIQGLEISHYEKQEPLDDGTTRTESWFSITPGIGLAHKGDDVSLENIAHVALKEVYSVTTIERDEVENEDSLNRLIDNRLMKVDLRNPNRLYLSFYSRSRDVVKKRLEKLEVINTAPILSAWNKTHTRPSGPGILVLEPIELIDEIKRLEDSQCQWDAEQDPFDDERLIDGCRLVFYPWPDTELGKPPAATDPQLRNKIAYQIFDYEQAQYQQRGRPGKASVPVDGNDMHHVHKEYRPYVPLPWEHYGVALALVHVTTTGNIRFLDTYAAMRKGGAPLSVRPMLEMNGSPFLWEARIQQFVAHMHELARDSTEIPDANKKFEVLPPVGLLPKQLIDFDNLHSHFFPSQFVVEAAPIPEEQLEVAMNASASLEPFDVYRPERVKLLVPVPQEVFEPDLLKKEIPDPIFLNTIRQLVYQIRRVLAARNGYRNMAEEVIGAIDLDDVLGFRPDQPTPDEGIFVGILPVIDIEDYDQRARDIIQALANWIHSNARMDNDSDYKLLTDTSKIGSADFPGLEQIIINFERKIEKTELYLSTGYLKAEADIYRLRQVMLGSEQVTRLATSPALGKIVEGYTRTPTVDDMQIYFARVAGEGTETVAAQTPAAVASAAADPATDDPATDDPVTVKGEETVDSTRRTLTAATRFAIDGRLAAGGISALWTDFKQPKTLESIRGQSRGKKVIERVYEAPAAEVKQNTVSTKSAVFGNLAEVLKDIDLEDSEVTVSSVERGILKSDDYDSLLDALSSDAARSVLENRAKKSDEFVSILTTPLIEAEIEGMDEPVQKELESIFSNNRGKNRVSLKDPGVANAIREGIFDPDPKDGDEANYFSVGVEALEHALDAMRKVDTRLDVYRKAVTQARRMLRILRENAVTWRTSLTEQENRLSELRHDALVARSLYDEERARVSSINQYRLRILEEYVTSLAYVRPRLVETRRDAPSIKLYAEYVNPVPACLAEDFDAADELRDMLDVFREVPVFWFTNAKSLVALLNYPLLIVEVYQHAVQRSQLQAQTPRPSMNYQAYHANAIGASVNQLVMAHRASAKQYHEEKVRIDTEALKHKSWQDLLLKAENDFSLADLIESGKGKSYLARKAASVMEDLEDVAVCFNNRCNELSPAIRLRWADKISTFDKSIGLSHLDILPSWDELDFIFRRDLQNMVDWLFSQVDSAVPEAGKLVNDLVRVCILLASHAPVSSIIHGYVPTPVRGKLGDIFDVAIDSGLVKVGMKATVMSENVVLVHGVVTDVAASAASIKVSASNEDSGQFSVGMDAQVMFLQGSSARMSRKG